MSVPRRAVFSAFLAQTLVLVLVLIQLAMPQAALAHRVFLFASVEEGAIVVEGRFSRNRPAQGAGVAIFEARSGTLLVQGVTDSQGRARFAIPEELARNPVDLRLVLDAGEGHQARWQLSAAELVPELSHMEGQAPASPPAREVGQDAGSSGAPATQEPVTPTAQELERIVNRALEAQIRPIREMLAAERARGPGLVEIIGGLGWIFAVFAALFIWKTRKKKGE